MSQPFEEACSDLIEPREAELILRNNLPPNQLHSTSDDYTEMCWHTPVARLYIGRPMLKAPAGFRYPNWIMNALGGIKQTINPTIFCAAKTVGASMLDLIVDSELRKEAWREFQNRIEQQYSPPLCDYPPPVNLPWPEYVETVRGREWWIPNF